jgi:uncharacterized membrane protein
MENEGKPSPRIADLSHDDPNNWKWGMFYYNKDDKRIFPPKRTRSLGWTINFANPLSIIAFLIILGSSIALALYLRSKG